MWSRCALLLMSHFYDQRGTAGLALACARRLLLVSQPSNSPDAYAVARCAAASAVLLGGDVLAACEDLVDVVAFCSAKGLPGVCLLAQSLIARCHLRIGACNLGMRAVCEFVAASETMANAVSLVEGQIMLARCMLEAGNVAACEALLRKTQSSVRATILNSCVRLCLAYLCGPDSRQVMERCSNALQAEWFHIRAACVVAPESVDAPAYAEAVRYCEQVRGSSSSSRVCSLCSFRRARPT